MVFRQPAPAPAIVRLELGPFGARVGRIFGALAVMMVAGLLTIGARSQPTMFACERGAGEEGTCRLRAGGRAVSLRAGSIRAVRANGLRPGAKSPLKWAITIWDERGAATVVATRYERQEATRARRAIRRFLDDRSIRRLRLDTPGSVPALRSTWAFVLLAGGVIALALVAWAMRDAGRLRVEIDRGNDELRVAWAQLGISRPRARVRLGDLEDAVLENDGGDGARIMLHARDGVTTPLAPRMLRGDHDRAIRALRGALGLEPVPPRPALPAIAAKSTKGRVALFVGAIFAVAFTGQAIVEWHADRTQGWLEIRARHRCSFQGAELLPGGAMRMALDPGRYTIRVWTRDGWQDQEVAVRKGFETIVECRPAGP